MSTTTKTRRTRKSYKDMTTEEKAKCREAAQAKKDSWIQDFADQIIKKLRKKQAPWQKPWTDEGIQAFPRNYLTGKNYRGANVVYLWMQGYDDPRWMTFKQAKSKGFKVRKGEKGTQIIYWKFLEKEEEVEDLTSGETVTVKRRIPMTKFYTVFNAEQIDGVEALPKPKKVTKAQMAKRVKRAEQLVKKSKAVINYNSVRGAYYTPMLDQISMPPREAFKSTEGFYGTLLHELSHWTGHVSRMNREMQGFGGKRKIEYAKEELHAEIGCWMLCGEIGVPHDPEQHMSYVSSWARIIKQDPFEIIKATQTAAKIMDYLLQFDATTVRRKKAEAKAAAEAEEKKNADAKPEAKKPTAKKPTTKKPTATKKPTTRKPRASRPRSTSAPRPAATA